ncbi:MAG TPA: hypothetical protein VIG33_15580 [Pseudobdellovibrionaceae bacterium]|jgi:hypothetical protein
MMGPRTPRYPNDDKNLIAEQPGRLILFSGILVAVVLGLIVRGLTAPNKVKAMIESAASRMHKDVKVEFEGVQISLSRGLLPRFAVIITKVKMESANECWMKPTLTADEVRLPLSLGALLQGEDPITQVEAGQVRIDLRSAYKNCEVHSSQPNEQAPKIKQFVTLKEVADSPKKTSASSQVRGILIDQLKIFTPNLPEPVELNSFEIRLKSNTPRVVEMTAKTHLMKDEQVGDYLSHATVWGEYSEFPQSTLQTRISGNWREGSYHLKSTYGMKEEAFTSEMELKHIPLSQAFQIFKKLQWLKEDLNGRQLWVSLNVQSSMTKSNLKTAQMHIKDLRLEGDLGDLKVAETHVVSLDPVKYRPFTVDIRRLNAEKLFALLNRPHPAPMLGQLGTFDGTAEVTDHDHIKLRGIHKGLEFIFSNKGQREVQVLKEVSAEISLDKSRWQIQVSHLVPDQGVFDGQLAVNADRDLKSLEVKARANEIRLAPNVIRLMTAGGQMGAFNGDMTLRFQEGQVNYIKGILNSESLDVEGVSTEKMRFNVDFADGEIQTQAQAQKMAIAVGSPAFQTLKSLIEPEWMIENRLPMKNISSQLHFKNFKVLNWKNFSAQLEKGGRFVSEGQWNAEGELSGKLQTQVGKINHKWGLGGKRDEPIFTSVDLIKKKSNVAQ